jgi:fluoride exporter
MVITVLLVLVCSGAGAIARFGVDTIVQSRRLGEFPLGTLVVNTSGCLLLGLLAGLEPSTDTMLVLGTATVGSYTTFSTWILETQRPAEDGERSLAWGNIVISFGLGLAAVALGRAVGRLL